MDLDLCTHYTPEENRARGMDLLFEDSSWAPGLRQMLVQ